MKHLKMVLAVVLLSGCEVKVDDLEVFIAEVKQTTTVNIEPYPEFESKPTFIYSADALRMPTASRHPTSRRYQASASRHPATRRYQASASRHPASRRYPWKK